MFKKDDKGIEGEVVIPFADGFLYPLRRIMLYFKSFALLTCVLALINVALSFLCGRTLICGIGEGTYCSTSGWLFIVSIIGLFGGISFYISKWFAVSEKQELLCFKFKKADLRPLVFVLFYLFCWGYVFWRIYALEIRQVTPDWRFELFLFVMETTGILVVLTLIANSVLLVSFLEGKKWWLLNKTFWPVFDNLHKLFVWFLFYFLVLAYIFRNTVVFFLKDETLPVWLNGLLGEFCFYFVIYTGVAVFISSLAYQAKYVLKEDNQAK